MAQFFRTSPIRRFFSLLQVDRQEIFSIYIYALFNGIVTLSLPLGIQAIINLIGGGQVSTSWIILVIFVIGGVAFTGVLQIMQLSISENLQQKIFTRSAFEFAYRIPRLNLEEVDKVYVPELVNRFFDTLSVQKGLTKILIDFSSASLQVLFALILLSLYHPFFILFSMLLVGIVFLIFRLTAPMGLRSSLEESTHKYEVAHWLEELARTMETFKLAGDSPLPMQKTDQYVQKYLAARKTHFKTLLVQFINLTGFKVIIAAGLLLIGGLLVINQQMNIGQFVASEIIIILVLASVEKLILSMETIYDVLTAIEKIGMVTDIPLEHDEGTTVHLDEEDEALSIHLRNLSYRFKGEKEDLIRNVNINFLAGSKVCLSGFSGSGKSMLIQMIAGIYDDYRGTIAYNEIPLGNWWKADLHPLIGDNLAQEDIFKGSLYENITLGDESVHIEKLREISHILGLTEWVESLTDGYNTQLIPEGRNLPKSIRLRIMLARSIAGSPQLILLEDNFNQLSPEDKMHFLDYVLAKPWTVIAVSNDPDVAEMFDKVIVMNQGEVIADGSLKAMQKKEWYNKVFQSH